MHFDDNLPVHVIDEQRNGEQTVHVINFYEDENILLLTTKLQPLDAPLTENELVLEQKLD